MADQFPSSSPNAGKAKGPSEPKRDVLEASSIVEMLVAQVLTQPPAAALPCNLTDEWLDLISKDLEIALDEETSKDADSKLLIVPMALVVHILTGQHNGIEQAWSFEELFARLQDYRIEVVLELLNRRTDIQATPATILTIFNQRKVIVEMAPHPKEYDK